MDTGQYQFLYLQPSGDVGVKTIHRVKARVAGSASNSFVYVNVSADTFAKLMRSSLDVVTAEEDCLSYLFGPPYPEAI